MPVTVEEKFDSRRISSGENPSVELSYFVRGTDDDAVVLTELTNASPATYGTLPRRQLQIEPIGDEHWEGRVLYGLGSDTTPPSTGDSVFSFDTGGGSQHITQSLSTIASHAPPGKTAPDYKGAIGVTNDSVEGVDITVPVYQFTETKYKPDAEVTEVYKGILFSLTGRINDGAFKGFAAGEVLFLGASGSKRNDEDWEITYRFAASPNITDLEVGDITGIAKKGWEYLWIRYTDGVDDTAKSIVKTPVAAYVEQVYRSGDFSGLGV